MRSPLRCRLRLLGWRCQNKPARRKRDPNFPCRTGRRSPSGRCAGRRSRATLRLAIAKGDRGREGTSRRRPAAARWPSHPLAIRPAQPAQRLECSRANLDSPTGGISQRSALPRRPTRRCRAPRTTPELLDDPRRQLLIVIGRGVELGDDRILSAAQQDRDSRQRFVGKRINEAVELGLGHGIKAAPELASAQSVDDCRISARYPGPAR